MVVSESHLSPQAFGRPAGELVVVYDGECPFCTQFVKLQKIRQSAGQVTLNDARNFMSDVEAARQAGLDLDQGMLVFWKGNVYEGGDAINILALLGSERGFPVVWRVFFHNAAVSRFLYPALRKGRNLALRLMGRKKLRD
jgi:predicted DCC family thiol-disulfide oxidoreductase YuxK